MTKTMLSLVTRLLWVLALSAALPAQATDKVGTTSMQVLKLPYGVRGIGMGNAGVALVRDAEAVWWNPGALTRICGPQVLLSQINMPAGVQLNSLVFAGCIDDYSKFSVHAINLFTDDIPVRTYERPEGTGENFNAYDFALGATYARLLTDRFSLGGNVRYLASGLEEETYSGFSIDLGTLYRTSLRSLDLAMSIQNLGPNVKYSGSFDDYRNQNRNGGNLVDTKYDDASLPTTFRLGVGFDAFQMMKITAPKDQSFDVAVEMNHPNDNRERLNLGGEYGFVQKFFVRVGGKFGYDEESWSAGFGLHVPVMSYRLKFDYAYSHWGQLSDAAEGFADQAHRMSIGFDWCNSDEEK
ncbi:PorV/PorQ family protein [candidate division KSB1 bacterium]|nr:PorV/PorQ family protein [candidate division KSB1 bacterium]